ncbi:MAG: transcription antitermination factor NusB [Verrucomicrobia bacterium]|nr:transcription antitermination factor NusB [Verrucomicrobiota bacterium]
MPIPKKKFREIIFQLLYSYDLSRGVGGEEIIPMMMETLSVSRSNLRQAQAQMEKVVSHLKELDHLIDQEVKNYEADRIGRVERAILRLGVYELLFDSHLPPKVVIAESLRLSKKFSSPESTSFVNAVIDGIREKEGIEVQQVEEDKNATFFGD